MARPDEFTDHLFTAGGDDLSQTICTGAVLFRMEHCRTLFGKLIGENGEGAVDRERTSVAAEPQDKIESFGFVKPLDFVPIGH
jgi:hypothetical protein